MVMESSGKDLAKLAQEKMVQVEKSICNDRKLLPT
jgi:hypothetical protein